jgi:hypothetical protein
MPLQRKVTFNCAETSKSLHGKLRQDGIPEIKIAELSLGAVHTSSRARTAGG